jgi:hypothetical protein
LIFITLPAFAGCSSHAAPSIVRILPGVDVVRHYWNFWSDRRSRHLRRFRARESSSVQLFVCSSVCFVVATLTWLTWFGQ